MTYIDIAVNLTSNKFTDDTNSILSDSFDNEIGAIILTGTSVSGTKAVMNLVEKYSNYQLYFTAGIHPELVNLNLGKKYLEQLRKSASNSKCVAIGETGLDFSKSFHNKEKQIQVFEEHIRLAIELEKPLFMHERKAGHDFVEILTKPKVGSRYI